MLWPMNKEYQKRINRAVDFILRNIGRDLTLDEIAGKACFSKYHFHRIFKAVTGETVSAHIRRLRLEKAANRLSADSGESITTIALDCGFGSSQNFATAFKRRFGCSPRDFRERYSLETWAASRDNQAATEGVVNVGNTGPDHFSDGLNHESKTNLWINLMDMPSYRVAYERVVGHYGFKNSEAAFKNLLKWAHKWFDIDASIAMGIVWDNPEVTEPQLCRYDACITIPEHITPKGRILIQEIKGGPYVVGHCEVSNYPELEQAYEDMFIRWFTNGNHIPADSVPYEIYLNNPANHPRENLLIDICIPVETL